MSDTVVARIEELIIRQDGVDKELRELEREHHEIATRLALIEQYENGLRRLVETTEQVRAARQKLDNRRTYVDISTEVVMLSERSYIQRAKDYDIIKSANESVRALFPFYALVRGSREAGAMVFERPPSSV